MKQRVAFYLPFKVSTNAIYAGIHWTQRKEHKDQMLWAFLPVVKHLNKVNRCKIRIDFEFARQPLDCSNCSYLAKMIEDCLTHYGIIPDDSPKYITEITISSRKGRDKVATLTLETED